MLPHVLEKLNYRRVELCNQSPRLLLVTISSEAQPLWMLHVLGPVQSQHLNDQATTPAAAPTGATAPTTDSSLGASSLYRSFVIFFLSNS